MACFHRLGPRPRQGGAHDALTRSLSLTASQGKLADAERYLRRALDEARAGFGPSDSHVAAALNNLAELYRLKRQYDDAVPLYEEALTVLVRDAPADTR